MKIKGATVQVGDRVLVRNVGLKGKQKLAKKGKITFTNKDIVLAPFPVR